MQPKILKQIYFIRHGRTGGNEKNTYQDGTVPLSVTGEKQAYFVGERFRSIPIEAIIASDYIRTKQTAAAIAEATKLKVETSELFREIRRPDDILGMVKTEEYADKIMKEMFSREMEPEWHYGNEENLFDAVKRARKALDLIKNRAEKVLTVVTHEIFIKMMMAAMAVEDDARAVRLFQDIRFFMIGENTGMTVAELVEKDGKENFRLHIWNDHAHLG